MTIVRLVCCTEVGPGDYVKVAGQWQKILSNTAYGQERTPRHWTVQTEQGSYGMWDIDAYARAEDINNDDEQGSKCDPPTTRRRFRLS